MNVVKGDARQLLAYQRLTKQKLTPGTGGVEAFGAECPFVDMASSGHRFSAPELDSEAITLAPWPVELCARQHC
jgi:hypothetical protein